MSSCPGHSLEDYLRWLYNITVADTHDANKSLQIAEALGTSIRVRTNLSVEQFQLLVAFFEDHRELVESRLQDFDEENQSWRGYAGCAFDNIPGALVDEGSVYIKNVEALTHH